jgi:tRNA(Ile)-lysidine synthase
MDFNKRFEAFWSKELDLPGNISVLLACSGGADSMVLATLLKAKGVELGIAHCNYQLRGAESDGDEAFVRNWAAENDCRFFVSRFNTKALVDELGGGLQRVARDLRYTWLNDTRSSAGFQFLATAHQASDSAETVLLNLFKGTGIAGLHGILPRAGSLVRPLLFTTRDEVRAYAKQDGITFREDSSNASTAYTRNALRHDVLPVIQKLYPDVESGIYNTACRISEAEILYRREVERQRKRLLEKRGADYYISIRLLQKTDALATILYELLTPFHFTAAAALATEALIAAETGRYIESQTHRITKNRDFLIITAREESLSDFYLIEQLPQTVQTKDGKVKCSLSKPAAISELNLSVEQIDASKVILPLILRRPRPGDYFYPLGMGGKKKKITRFLTDAKLPSAVKSRIWVLESDRRIVWVAGQRIDERFKITSKTLEVIKLEFKPA